MGDIKLFHIEGDHVDELIGQSFPVEKSLQTLIERHLEVFLSVRFLASEYSTGKTHGGSIDTLGIDKNGFPVIIEYKRASNDNVIGQGLFYLNWLLDHRAEFELMVMRQYGAEAADEIDWSNPRLLCIAGHFTRYDEHTVQEISRNIELIRYRRYGEDLLLLELITAATALPRHAPAAAHVERSSPVRARSQVEYDLERASIQLQDLYGEVEAFLMALGDDVQKKVTVKYIAFLRNEHFACIRVNPKAGRIMIWVKVDPDTVTLEAGFTRDMQEIGHYGTGDLEIRIESRDDLERAKPFLMDSYEAS